MNGPISHRQLPDPSGPTALASGGPRVDAGRHRLPRGLLVGAWILAAGLHLAQGPEGRVHSWPMSYLVLEVLAALSLAGRAIRSTGRARTAWWLLSASAFLEVPNLVLIDLHHRGFLSLAGMEATSYLSLATGVLVLAGVLSFPTGPERVGRFWRRVMDSLIFATSMLFLLWVLGVQGSLRSADQGVGLRVLAAYLNVALLGGGLVFMTSYHPDRIRGPLGWLAASALAWLAALTCWTLSGLPSVIAREAWIILAGAIPLFQGLAAWSSRSVEEVLNGGSPDRRVAGLLPYLPVTLAVLTFAALLIWSPLNVTRGAFAIFLGMVVLLLMRQFQAIQDLRAARRTLEARVTERTRALEQAQDTLLRTERMNTLALMGAGLAHDLNNLLTAVRSSAELAALNLEAGITPKPQDLTRMLVAADSATQLTGRLMAFARREAEDLLPMDLGHGVREMEATLRLLVPRSVNLRIEVVPGEPLIVRTSRLRLEQMLVNLVANAGDAMPRGGKLTIRVKAAPGGEQAMVEVIDSGQGMGPETLERIFEPFFTTKAPGKGTGLGLSSLRAMLDESGGRLTVHSELGKGSRFCILLPVMPTLELNPR